MAELDIGKHCDLKDCKRLDFLPFECDGCSGIFCLDHKGRTAHACSEVNYVVEAKQIDHPIYSCTYQECKASELVPVKCELCTKQYCLSHRLPEDHECQNLHQREKDETLQKKISALAETAKQKSDTSKKKKRMTLKQQKMAAKVSLMKLKMKANGDSGIPVERRVYFDLCLSMKEKNEPIFLDSTWSVGRIIDSVSLKQGITNTNNTSLEKRLILCNQQTGSVLSYSITLDEAIKQELIFSGSSLEIKYESAER